VTYSVTDRQSFENVENWIKVLIIFLIILITTLKFYNNIKVNQRYNLGRNNIDIGW